jgi:hypothetical protein
MILFAQTNADFDAAAVFCFHALCWICCMGGIGTAIGRLRDCPGFGFFAGVVAGPLGWLGGEKVSGTVSMLFLT